MRKQDKVPDEASPARPATARTTRADSAAIIPGAPLSAHAVLGLQRAVGNLAVSALITARDGCGHAKPVQRSSVPDALRSAGKPIESGLREDMEARLGADFADVRLHTDTAAQRSAAEVGALAYTSGHHIVSGASGIDNHTLAHELTHVIQQRQGPVAGTDRGDGLAVSDPSDRFERAAEANATRVMRGSQPALTQSPRTGLATGMPVQRETLGGRIAANFVGRQEAFQDLVGRVLGGASDGLRQEIAQTLMQRNGWNNQQLNQLGNAQLLWHLADILLDPAYDFNGSAALAEELAEHLGPEQSLELLRRDILDPVHFASCYPTAKHLFPLLSGLTANEGETREQLADRAAATALGRGDSNNMDDHPNADSFRAEVGRLIVAIQNAVAGDREAVYRIEFAGHGFTLVLRHPEPGQPLHVELIESLAHAASLDPSLRQAGRPVDTVLHGLWGMASDDYPVRRAAAATFGWNAAALFLHDTGPDADNPLSSYPDQRARGENAHVGEYFPRTRMKWWANLITDDTGMGLWADQATARFARLDQLFPAPAAG